MVTLKNLHNYSLQEVADFVTNHLLTQNQRALSPLDNTCAYRGMNGLKCAIGALIPEEDYNPLMEGRSFRFRIMPDYYLATLKQLKASRLHVITMLEDFQGIHDFQNPETWRECIKKLYCNWELKWL